MLYAVCAFFGLLTLLFVGNSGHLTALVLFVVGVVIVLAVGRLRYHEVDELKAGVKRNVSERRVRGANNIRVRRATRSIAKADTLGQLYDAVIEVLKIGEFGRAVMIIGRRGEGEWNAGVLEREPALRRAAMREEMIWWDWAKEDLDPTAADGFWTLRLPLSSANRVVGHLNLYRGTGQDGVLLDINYLCTLFQKETTKAVERILEQPAEAERQLAARA